MTAQKYPNKRKRKGYWKVYDRARIKDFRKIWQFAIEIVQEQGCPFVKKDKRGRKPKFVRDFYAAFCIVMVCFDFSLREMEGEIPLLANNTLDHSVIDWWFAQLDDEWVTKATRNLGDKIEAMFKKGEYIADSTEYTTTRYQEIIDTGTKKLVHSTMKLHLLVCYFVTVGIICIKNAYPSHGDANDNPVLREHLLEDVNLRKGRRLHADKGYDSEENLRKCMGLDLVPNIVERNKGGTSIFRTIYREQIYDDDARKQNRGLIEGVFGGTTTDTDNKTRFVRDRCRKTHLALVALRHQIRTLFRALEIKALSFVFILRQPRKH
jgi:hypothetical protein